MQKLLSRYSASPIVKLMALVFLSRVILFISSGIGLTFVAIDNPDLWRAYPDNVMLDGWLRWDSGWYISIVQNGYVDAANIDPESARNTAFFPLYPISISLLSALVRDPYLSAVIVSNVCFFLAIFLFFKFVELKTSPEIAWRAALILCVFPFSFFFNAAYSESIFLVFVMGAFLLAEKQLWLAAALMAALASATRPMGIFVGLGVFLTYMQQIDFDYRRVRWDILQLGIAGLGLMAYMIFLFLNYGNPLEFMQVQNVKEWGVTTNLFPLDNSYKMLFLLFVILSVYAGLRRTNLGIASTTWALLMCVVCYFKMYSFARLGIVIFPAFIGLAVLVRHRLMFYTLMVVSSVLLLYYQFEFSHWKWVAFQDAFLVSNRNLG